jgi:hypothetical protein
LTIKPRPFVSKVAGFVVSDKKRFAVNKNYLVPKHILCYNIPNIKKEKLISMQLLILTGLAVALVAGFLLGGIFSDCKYNHISESLSSSKVKNKKKVVDLLSKQTKITNDNIEKLLKVSDATATRYLSELEKEGIIKQYGKTGRHVYYKKV